jgi:hypothetical protein
MSKSKNEPAYNPTHTDEAAGDVPMQAVTLKAAENTMPPASAPAFALASAPAIEEPPAYVNIFPSHNASNPGHTMRHSLPLKGSVRFCTKCGIAIAPDANFCTKCGVPKA